MKEYKIFCIISLFYLFHFEVASQSSLTFYSGVNISTSKYTSERTATNIDSSVILGSSTVQPNLGVDIEFMLSEQFSFYTGIGVSLIGTNNYFDYDLPQGINIDRDLKLSYLKVPLMVKLEFINNFSVVSGYSLSYCYRKNINLFNYIIGSPQLSSNFNEIYHAANLGLLYDKDKYIVSVNYQFGLSRIWDTGNHFEERRDYLTINSFILNIGYKLSDK